MTRLKFVLLCLLAITPRAEGQTAGSIVGRVVDAATGEPVVGADVQLRQLSRRTATGPDGRFVLGSVPAGERVLEVSFVGYKRLIVERLLVQAGRATDINIRLESSPFEVDPLIVRADRARLIEPEVSATHEVVVGREMRELPVDDIDQVLELTSGVSGGHFRGGRIGQELHVIDGIPLKNQLEASQEGLTLELSPTSLDEVDVMTGGFGAQFGGALSGVVSYTTRRGNPDGWETAATLTGDRFLPESAVQGFTGVTLSAGGPVSVLGKGATIFADVLLQSFLDADTRARGLTCLEEGDAEGELAAEIRNLQSNPKTAQLYCPYTRDLLPHQRGDKYIAFARFDKPLSQSLHFSTSFLRNRTENELYSSEFKYHPTHQLGQRFTGSLATASLEWLRNAPRGATSVNLRTALMRLDRYLGAVDPATFEGGSWLGFRPGGFEFIGEEFARRPIDEQLELGSAIPGYEAPRNTIATPFGPSATGIFYTSGTPTIASWSRTNLGSIDLSATRFTPKGSSYSGGVSTKLYHVETYERALAHVAGSTPSYARFYPATAAAFADAIVKTDDDFHFNFGVRVEGFRSGVNFQEDRMNFLSPVIETGWNVSVMPRLGIGMPIPGTAGKTAVRVNYGRVAQPPDFRYFIDSTVGDSLRTDIHRQGNPTLSFERGSTYEIGVSQLFSERVSMGATVYRKDLTSLVSGSASQYGLNDFGSVKGLELTLRARMRFMTARASWVLQKAAGRSSGVDSDTVFNGEAAFSETPLAFDRRHSADLALLFGSAAEVETPWSLVLTTNAQSGYPLFEVNDNAGGRKVVRYLPWTSSVDLRAGWNFGSFMCGDCRWRALVDARNILNMENVLGLHRATGTLGPTLEQVRQLANSVPLPTHPIPRESPLYVSLLDGDNDGVISIEEADAGRFAAALDRYDPSLYFGQGRALRIGMEIAF